MKSYTISRSCEMCGDTTKAKVATVDLFRYCQGAFVQDAFPYLDRAVREALFQSGICAKCFRRLG